MRLGRRGSVADLASMAKLGRRGSVADMAGMAKLGLYRQQSTLGLGAGPLHPLRRTRGSLAISR